jgi:membrane protein
LKVLKDNELKSLFLKLKKRFPNLVEEITIQASSLSFYTIFSIVPILLIILSLLASNPMFNEYYQKIETFILSNILPTNQETIKVYISSFVQNSKSMGITGGIYIFVTSILFFQNFETIMTKIFNSNKRNLWDKITIYWTTMTLFPILFSFSIYLSIKIQSILNQSSYTEHINILAFIPFFTVFVMFWLAYNLGANKELNIKAISISSLLSTIIFSIAKSLFVYYVIYNKNYTSLYGSFSIVLFIFVWIYVSWIIFISGAHLCAFLDTYFKEKDEESTKNI